MNRRVEVMEMAMRRALGQVAEISKEDYLTDAEIEKKICTLEKNLGITALKEENLKLKSVIEAFEN